MKDKKYPYIICVVVICLLTFLGIYDHNINETDAADWVVSNGESVIDTRRGLFDNGPYWYGKTVQIVRIVTDRGNVYWFRYYCWNRTIKKELADGDYEIIED